MTTNDYRRSAVAKTANGMDSPYYKKSTIYATRLEVAEALGIRPETVSRWTSSGVIPVIRLGRLVRYDLAAIAKHLSETKTVKPKGGKK
jgi:excisionase family DNA binding protein